MSWTQYEDLKRIVNFHPISFLPDLIKEVSYIAFWWLKRKPVFVPCSEKIKTQVLFFNEWLIATYIVSEIFDHECIKNTDSNLERHTAEWNIALNLLFYYLVYRIDSPKILESFLIGCTLTPIWDPKW